jgi:two-component system sensor histidine kinase MtrB
MAWRLAVVSRGANEFPRRADPHAEPPSADETYVPATSVDRIRAERRIDRDREFVAHVSHELRTPLTALQAAAEILASRRSDLPDDVAEAADLVVDRSRRMVRLVQELLELTELESGKAPIRWEVVDLRALLVTLLARRDRVVAVNGDSVITYGDKARLERIIGNFVDNAFEHGEGAGVEISVRERDREVILAVNDKGPGIPPEDVPHLFEHFFKTGRSRARRRGGIGLGLPIAYENARLLGATIHVDSFIGRGSAFSLRLPLRSSPPEGAATADET